jgi:lysophospholipase L1-like esterase
VPASADIVAIGDSHTYGVSAKGIESWPAQLARMTGAEVYNLGLGGYGPIEYDYLLRNRALQLDPKTVVVGVYLGNDFMNAYNSVYKRTGWEQLRVSTSDGGGDEASLPTTDPAPEFARVRYAGIREWFVSHSVIYRMAAFSFGEFIHRLDVEDQARRGTRNFVILSDRAGDLVTVFTPDSGLYVLNTESRKVQEGIRLTGEILIGMKDLLASKKIRFLVLVLPTKESAYWPTTVRLSEHPDETLVKLVHQEAAAKAMLMERLEENGVCVEDLLPDLRARIDERPLYPNNDDGHPNRNGYEVIAEKVSRILATDLRCGGD